VQQIRQATQEYDETKTSHLNNSCKMQSVSARDLGRSRTRNCSVDLPKTSKKIQAKIFSGQKWKRFARPGFPV